MEVNSKNMAKVLNEAFEDSFVQFEPRVAEYRFSKVCVSLKPNPYVEQTCTSFNMTQEFRSKVNRVLISKGMATSSDDIGRNNSGCIIYVVRS